MRNTLVALLTALTLTACASEMADEQEDSPVDLGSVEQAASSFETPVYVQGVTVPANGNYSGLPVSFTRSGVGSTCTNCYTSYYPNQLARVAAAGYYTSCVAENSGLYFLCTTPASTTVVVNCPSSMSMSFYLTEGTGSSGAELWSAWSPWYTVTASPANLTTRVKGTVASAGGGYVVPICQYSFPFSGSLYTIRHN